MYIANERIYLDETRTKVVPESEGHFVLCGPGATLTDEQVAFFKLDLERLPEPEPVPPPMPLSEGEIVIESPPVEPVPDPAPDILEPVIDDEPEPVIEEKAIEEPPENKAIKTPPEKKSGKKRK